jgi:hypothetical protein
MKSIAENPVPSRKALLEEIRRVNALLERSIAGQMAAAWHVEQTGIDVCSPALAHAEGAGRPAEHQASLARGLTQT